MSVALGALVCQVYPELVDQKTGEEELKGLSFTGGTASKGWTSTTAEVLTAGQAAFGFGCEGQSRCGR